jgi:DNA-binding CsgD family transcriptional regulator/tetratricopeptide (TPR) repeat protein
MVPAIRDQLQLPLSAAGEPVEARRRLLTAVLDFLRRAAEAQPLLLILEDLHDADRGTLDLLVHLGRNLEGTRLLLVGTYRDLEVDHAHPLATALIDLRRAKNFARLYLRGLSVDDVQRLLASASQQAIPRPFVDLVHRRTEGNPLFVHETLRFVVDQGLVERRDGALRRVGEESLAGYIPEGLRDVVVRRLSRLNGGTNQLLSAAAAIGREFPLDVLWRVCARPEAELEAALEDAVRAAILNEHAVLGANVTYRFSHAFFRQTLYDEIIAPRRIRLHQQIARALEQVYASGLEEHAAELAEHYAFSADATELKKAVHYGRLAARHAIDVFAHAEAVYQLERALQVQTMVDPDDVATRCDLLLELAEVLGPSGDTDKVIRFVAPEAVSLAEALADRHRAFRACRLAIESLEAQGASTAGALPEYLEWGERGERCAEEAIDRAYANLALSHAWYSRGHFTAARSLRLRAVCLAREAGDPDTLFKSAFALLNFPEPRHWPERVLLAREAVDWPREGVSGRALSLLLWSAASIELAEGNRARAIELWSQLEETAARTHTVTATLFVQQRDVVLAIIEGRLEDAFSALEGFVDRADELGAAVRGREFNLILLLPVAVYLGRAQGWLTAYEDAARMGMPPETAGAIFRRAICLFLSGSVEEARSLAGPLLDEEPSRTGEDDRDLHRVTVALHAALTLEHAEAARSLAARLACVGHLATGDWVHACMARLLGQAALLIGDRASARRYFAQALETAGKIGFRPELALTHLHIAEQLLEDADHSGALQHLGLVIPELEAMRMRPALERALRAREVASVAESAHAARRLVSDGLTSREREISGLLVAGRSNRDIAQMLVITEGTVEVHVKHILSKLGFTSRAQIATWANERGLADER